MPVTRFGSGNRVKSVVFYARWQKRDGGPRVGRRIEPREIGLPYGSSASSTRMRMLQQRRARVTVIYVPSNLIWCRVENRQDWPLSLSLSMVGTSQTGSIIRLRESIYFCESLNLRVAKSWMPREWSIDRQVLQTPAGRTKFCIGRVVGHRVTTLINAVTRQTRVKARLYTPSGGISLVAGTRHRFYNPLFCSAISSDGTESSLWAGFCSSTLALSRGTVFRTWGSFAICNTLLFAQNEPSDW